MLNNNLKVYRKKFKITQEEIAKRIGVKKQYISQIERNNIDISVSLSLKIVKAFKDITKEKGQQIKITVDDIFYLK